MTTARANEVAAPLLPLSNQFILFRSCLAQLSLGAALLVLAVAAAPGSLRAQAAQQPGRLAPAAQGLPLSGRAQAGGVAPAPSEPPAVQVLGLYQGSVVHGEADNDVLPLSLADALQRGLQFNLGAIGSNEAQRQARALRLAAVAQLLPDIIGSAQASEQQVNLPAMGLSFHIPISGFSFPTSVRYHFVDAQANVSQSFSFTALRNAQAAGQNAKSAELNVADSRELVALAVSGAYLQLVATAARIQTVEAQIQTAQTIYQQALDRNMSGLAAHIDVTRSQVELQTQQERLTALDNDFEKQKIVLARLIGLPMAQRFTLADSVTNRQPPAPDLDALIRRSLAQRPDVQSAAAQVRAAEMTRRAAVDERLPSLAISGDYGATGVTPASQVQSTFAVTGTVQVPIVTFGRIRSDVQQADSALNQRRAEYEDAKGRAEADVRNAVLDLTTALQQIRVTESNRGLAAETLAQSSDRFRAGVADTVAVVQAQEAVASAEQDYITALFSLNLAEVSLARATGENEQGMLRELQGQSPLRPDEVDSQG